jgi:hypothetical protein
MKLSVARLFRFFTNYERVNTCITRIVCKYYTNCVQVLHELCASITRIVCKYYTNCVQECLCLLIEAIEVALDVYPSICVNTFIIHRIYVRQYIHYTYYTPQYIYYTDYRQVCLYLMTEAIEVDFGGGFLTPFVHFLQAVEL